MGVMGGCRGSARPTGRLPNRIPWFSAAESFAHMNADHADVVRYVCDDPEGSTTRPPGIRRAGQHAGSAAVRCRIDA